MLRADPELRAFTIFRPKMVHLPEVMIHLHSLRQGVYMPLLAWTGLHNNYCIQNLLLFVAFCFPSPFEILYEKKVLWEYNAANRKKVNNFREFDFVNFRKSNILGELNFTNYVHKIDFFCSNFISRNSTIWFHLFNEKLGNCSS